MKSRFPLHTRNQRAGKALLAQRAKCHYQPPFGPENFLLEFLSSCAYSGLVLCFFLLLPGCGHAPGALPTATSTRHHHLHDGMEFMVLPKEVTSDQPFISIEKTPVHHEEIYPLRTDVNKKKTAVQHCLWSAGFGDQQDLACPTSWCQLQGRAAHGTVHWQQGWGIGI